MQNCYQCGQDVVLAQQDKEWKRLNPGGGDHQCSVPKKLWVICAGCKKILATGSGPFEEADRKEEVSHGMCKECLGLMETETNDFWNSAIGNALWSSVNA
jgi:hypothetical protein